MIRIIELNKTGVFIKRENLDTHMHTGRALCEDEAEFRVTLPELRGTEGCQQSTRSRGEM